MGMARPLAALMGQVGMVIPPVTEIQGSKANYG